MRGGQFWKRHKPLERALLCEKARLDPLAYRHTLFDLRSAAWQLRRIECMLRRVSETFDASTGSARRSDNDSKLLGANGANAPSILKPPVPPHGAFLVYTATLSLNLRVATMALLNSNNRRSWLPWARRDRKMNNDEATFWLSQFIGKNLRIHASDGRVFGGQMKCTDKVSTMFNICLWSLQWSILSRPKIDCRAIHLHGLCLTCTLHHILINPFSWISRACWHRSLGHTRLLTSYATNLWTFFATSPNVLLKLSRTATSS